MLFSRWTGSQLTDDSPSLPAGLLVGHISMVADLFQFDLVVHGGSGQGEVLEQEPDLAVTLQTGLGCRDTAEQGHQQQQHPTPAQRPAPRLLKAPGTESSNIVTPTNITFTFYCEPHHHSYSCCSWKWRMKNINNEEKNYFGI